MRVLVVDDEENVRKGLATFLRLSGHEATCVPDLEAAKSSLEGGSPYGAALVDLYIGTESGAALLDYVAERGLKPPLIMMSGRGTVKEAVASLRKGAYDFLEKPLDTDRLLATLRNIEREGAAERRLEALRGEWLSEHLYFEPGTALARSLDSARKAAASPLSILVSGPTGSGKELVARYIHLCSPRSQGPFVAVNCAAIPADLGESALFGSRKGSYTGSVADREGYFEAASGGTLFLDEAGELSPSLQAAILRAVELGEIQRIGESEARKVDLRIVAATNRDLRSEAQAGRFREDLYWRLAQVEMSLPSLAERRSEIRGLCGFFADRLRAQMGVEAPILGEGGLGYLEARSWPGNVRELKLFIERALWLAAPGSAVGAAELAALEPGGGRAGAAAIGSESRPGAAAEVRPSRADIAAGSNGGGPGRDELLALLGLGEGAGLSESKEVFERALVRSTLEAAGGSVARAAGLLGLLPNNLSRKVKELGLR